MAARVLSTCSTTASWIGGEGSLAIRVIPDTGTDGLAGLTGTMTIAIAPGGAHSYEFTYDLP